MTVFHTDTFGLSHLSEDAVAAFADGVLSQSARARATRHCSECCECAEAVDDQLEARRLIRLADPPVMPSGLMDRLAGLPMTVPLTSPAGSLSVGIGADGTAAFLTGSVEAPLPIPTAGPAGLVASDPFGSIAD